MIATERLVLREMTMADYDALYAVLADSDIMQHYPYTFDEKRVRGWIERNQERYRHDGFGLWAVTLRETGEMIGDCGLTLQQIDGKTLPEIGYHIRADRQRRGYAREAATAVRDWAFENTDYDALYSYCKYTNVPSYKTAESAGMHFWKEYADETNEVTHVSIITRDEWQALKKRERLENAMPECIQLINDDWEGHAEKRRHACRGILCRDGRVLLEYLKKTDRYLIPGGGLEGSESYGECCEREMLEETGVRCRAVKHYLDIEELFGVWQHINHYFVCEYVEDTGRLELTEQEKQVQATYVWLPLKDALAVFAGYEKYHASDIAVYGLYRREYTALKRFAEMMTENE